MHGLKYVNEASSSSICNYLLQLICTIVKKQILGVKASIPKTKTDITANISAPILAIIIKDLYAQEFLFRLFSLECLLIHSNCNSPKIIIFKLLQFLS